MAEDRIRPNDVAQIVEILMGYHAELADIAFDPNATPEDRQKSVDAAHTIRRCVNRICIALLDTRVYETFKRNMLKRLSKDSEVAIAKATISEWTE